MKTIYDKIKIIKQFIIKYEKRKIKDEIFLNVLKEIYFDMESEIITKEKLKWKNIL